ncbi:MAG TPA: KamA family radical SAM protein [Anaeromyxobacteraceae bacterium]|nr:KamA family radical SAM protein [Anaeromyxobacteraceae bacterium]
MSWRERFPGATEAEWNDWRWQLRHALRTPEALSRIVDLTSAEQRGLARPGRLRVGTTPYYASLMDGQHAHCPIRRQVIPVEDEGVLAEGILRDPLGEDRTRPVRAVVHRYPDRALFLATDTCQVYCRHCTRRRITGGEERPFDRAAAEEGIGYVRAHPEIRDVIVSGGDPLVLDDDWLAWLLGKLRAVPHVEILRLATRALATCPMRVDTALARLLRQVKPLFVITQFNHPKECTLRAQEACELLVDQGVPVENQTVLLRRINSSARTIACLNQRLLSWRVRPYYLHQGDLAEDTNHLRTPLACGIGILESLRGHTSGLAVPHLAVDLPGGGGKVTLQPNYLLGGKPAESRACGAGTWFRNYRGEPYFYPEPTETDCNCPYDEIFFAGADRSTRRGA